MAVWVVLEIVSMYFSAKYERQSSFGSLFKDPVTMKQACLHDLVQTVMWMAVVASVIHFMGGFEDAAFFKLYFRTPTCIIAGIMTTCFAIYNLVYQIKLPKKPVVVEGKKPLP